MVESGMGGGIVTISSPLTEMKVKVTERADSTAQMFLGQQFQGPALVMCQINIA